MTNPPPSTTPRRSLCLAALATLVLAGACQAPPSPSPQASPVVTATPAATVVATPAISPAGLVAFELQRTSGALAAGRYTRAEFAPRITLDVVGSTWQAINLLTDFFDVQNAPSTPDVIAVQFARPEGIYGAGTAAAAPADAAGAVELLRANPNVTVVETSESRMDGLVGAQVTVENPATGIGTASVIDVPAGALGIDPGRRLWIAFFDTSEGLLAIMVGGSTARWEDALQLAEPVLESVTIGR